MPDQAPASTSGSRSGVERRPGLDHPVRKALYAITGARRGVNQAELDIQSLIVDLRRHDTDPETWDEVVQLRRDLRVAASQLDHAMRAAQMWSRKAGGSDG